MRLWHAGRMRPRIFFGDVEVPWSVFCLHWWRSSQHEGCWHTNSFVVANIAIRCEFHNLIMRMWIDHVKYDMSEVQYTVLRVWCWSEGTSCYAYVRMKNSADTRYGVYLRSIHSAIPILMPASLLPLSSSYMWRPWHLISILFLFCSQEMCLISHASYIQ